MFSKSVYSAAFHIQAFPESDLYLKSFSVSANGIATIRIYENSVERKHFEEDFIKEGEIM